MGRKRWASKPTRRYLKSRIRDFRAAQTDSNVPAFMTQSFQQVLQLQPLPEPTPKQLEDAKDKLEKRALGNSSMVTSEAVMDDAKEQVKAKIFNVSVLLE